MNDKADMLFLKTIRFDNSDLHVFDNAAEPGEWAVSGAFAFADLPETIVTGKLKQAFANGILGTNSFGWSTLACIAEIDDYTCGTIPGNLVGKAEVTSELVGDVVVGYFEDQPRG